MQQLSMFVQNSLPNPVVMKSNYGPLWTAPQILQITLPPSFDCCGEKYIISKSEVHRVDFSRDAMSSIVSDIVTSIYFLKGPRAVLRFFNSLQPLLMENLYAEGFSVSLRDLFIPSEVLENIQADIQKILPLLYHLRASYSESVALQLENYLRSLKTPITNFILNSACGHLIECKSESAVSKVVQQIGFLGMQISDRGKFYSPTLFKGMSSLFRMKYPFCDDYPTEEFGLVGRPLFRGLNPYQEMVHSIANREVTVRSTRGLTEPGTLFKNLMAILRDVVICHDNTIRNKCSNSIIQFEYGINNANITSEFCAGDPVGVLAATAISNPAYKAVLDSSPNSNSSWEMMKEILLCAVSFKNDISDRRVILYLNDCSCGRKHCQENAALIVKNHLKKVSLKEVATEFMIEYRGPQMEQQSIAINSGLVGHIHLNKTHLMRSNVSIHDILEKCQVTMDLQRKKKKTGNLFKFIDLSCSESCTFCLSSESKWTNVPCIQFFWQGVSDDLLERASHTLCDTVSPVLLETIIKGDPRVSTANIIWSSSDTTSRIRSHRKISNGEMALDVVLEKEAVRKSGDAWRIVMDSCLPVIHLIDTRRSIPYAIKQVEELVGMFCAFEQAVQRLSTSVTMVTKGVLKDHLLLLVNSMTCSGNLIGFNAGGIKSLYKSLGVQLPFTDATLFTPRKCFERAAEKCHVDALSSVVASCAWGKPVCVGTGSPFEIIWDSRKAGFNTEKEIDVYDFLQLVINSSKLEGGTTDCLGADIEDLELEDEYMGLDLSPVHESGLDKPSFVDGVEFDGDDSDPFSKQGEKESQNGWSAWGEKVDSEVNNWNKKANQSTCPEEAQNGSAWGKTQDSDGGGWEKKSGPSKWGKPSSTDPPGQSNLVTASSETTWAEQITHPKSSSTWGTSEDWVKADSDSQSQKQQNDSSLAWGITKVDTPTEKDEPSQWGGANAFKPAGWGRSGSGKQLDTTDWVKADSDSQSLKQRNDSSSAWGISKVDTPIEKDEPSQWGGVNSIKSAGWGRSGSGKVLDTTDWVKADPDSQSQKQRNDSSLAWGITKIDSPIEKDEPSQWGRGNSFKSAGWGRSESGKELDAADQVKFDSNSQSQKQLNDSSLDWGITKLDTPTEKDEPSQWGAGNSAPTEKDEPSQWGAGNSVKSAGWGRSGSGKESDETDWVKGDSDSQSQKQKNDSSVAWGSSKIDASIGKDEQSQWSGGNSIKSSGWSRSGSGKDLDATDSWSSWQKKISKSDENSTQPDQNESNFSSSVDNSKPSNTWTPSNDWNKGRSGSPTGEKKESPSNNFWDSNQKSSNDSTHNQGWGSGEKDTRSQRGRGGRSRGRGSSNAGDWKNRSRPARPADDPNAVGVFTATRQRLDSFPVEEQDVLSEIETIMKNIRRIMHQTGYNDGDPLPADDQKYIVDNVLDHHPDKSIKMGGGLDYIMVNKHREFQESRCMYAVSVDGGKEDFSYRKCLENYIRQKHPDQAESFIPKYFKKPQPRPGWNKDRGGPRGEAGTPNWNTTPGLDEAGTPKTPRTPTWNSSQTPGPEDASNPGWNSDKWNSSQTPGPEDASDPGSNSDKWNSSQTSGTEGASNPGSNSDKWNRDQTPGPDDSTA